MKKIRRFGLALILLSLTILTALPPIHVANAQSFTRVGALTLNPGEDNISAAIIDPAAGFAYFATDTSPGVVVKVRLSNFTRVGSLTLNPGEDKVKSSVIDPAAGFAYFATRSSMSTPRIIV